MHQLKPIFYYFTKEYNNLSIIEVIHITLVSHYQSFVSVKWSFIINVWPKFLLQITEKFTFFWKMWFSGVINKLLTTAIFSYGLIPFSSATILRKISIQLKSNHMTIKVVLYVFLTFSFSSLVNVDAKWVDAFFIVFESVCKFRLTWKIYIINVCYIGSTYVNFYSKCCAITLKQKIVTW